MTELFTAEAEARVDQLTARSQGIAEDRALAARCWDLGQLAADYEAWIGSRPDKPACLPMTGQRW